MALTYVGGTSGGGTGASYTVSLNATLTGGSNSSPSAGDLILVFTGEANGASVTSTCSGNTAGAYSTIRAHQNQADTHDANLDSFYKFAGSTPDTTLTITRGNNNTTYGSSTVVHVWRGAATDAPFNVTPTIAASANGSAANPAAITPTTAGSVVLYCGHASQLAASGTVFTTAGTYPISRKTDGSTGDSIVMASHYTGWTSGAYDPAAFAGSTTATSLGWVALTIVIAPEVRSLTCSSGSYTYTGTSATLMRNRVAVPSAGAYTYTGSSATLTKGAALVNRELTANAGSYTYTGSTAALVKGKRLVTTAGSYSYTGSTAVLLRNRALVSNAGSYTYTGQSATLSRGRPLTASAGSYAYAGQTAAILKNRSLTASAGSYAYAGQTTTLSRGRQLAASPGSYTTTGQSVTLAYGRAVTAQAGSYALTGSSADLAKGAAVINRTLTAQAGSYTYTGQSATLLLGRSLAASAGSYGYAGQSAALSRGLSITAQSGSYTLTGNTAAIAKEAAASRSLTALAGSYTVAGQSLLLSRDRHLTASSGAYAYTGWPAICAVLVKAFAQPPAGNGFTPRVAAGVRPDGLETGRPAIAHAGRTETVATSRPSATASQPQIVEVIVEKIVERIVEVPAAIPGLPAGEVPRLVTVDGVPVLESSLPILAMRDAAISERGDEIARLLAEVEALSVLLMATIQ